MLLKSTWIIQDTLPISGALCNHSCNILVLQKNVTFTGPRGWGVDIFCGPILRPALLPSPIIPTPTPPGSTGFTTLPFDFLLKLRSPAPQTTLVPSVFLPSATCSSRRALGVLRPALQRAEDIKHSSHQAPSSPEPLAGGAGQAHALSGGDLPAGQICCHENQAVLLLLRFISCRKTPCLCVSAGASLECQVSEGKQQILGSWSTVPGSISTH